MKTRCQQQKGLSKMKKIAVIGAGPSGLAAIKSCKEEGMEVVCYEKTDSFGGLWYYRENSQDGIASVMKTTVTNTSKEMTAFSDFPPPKEFPLFLTHTRMLEYLRLYAEAFNLLDSIRYNVEVVRVRPADDFDETGKWVLTVKTALDECMTEVFDAVMICTGHHGYPSLPTFRNQRSFKGTAIHSRSLKTVQEYEDMNVMVVGFGNSAVDAAVEISNYAKQVYLSTRRGSWIFPRIVRRGLPTDMTYLRRKFKLVKSLTFNGACYFVEKELNKHMDHAMYNVKPNHRALDQIPTVNDILPDKILSGMVVIKGDVSRFTEDGVIFQGETEVTKLDAVVFATGYQMKYPFLQDGILTTSNQELNLYKYVFPISLSHPTLAFIGMVQPSGAIIPVLESQCRWASLVFNQKIKLPDEETMSLAIRKRREAAIKRFVCSPRHAIQVDWMQYMDDLASEYGTKPNLSEMLLKDPSLFHVCFMGPCLPYQYRLQGPHAWSGARDAILTCNQRISLPVLRNVAEKKICSKSLDCTQSNLACTV